MEFAFVETSAAIVLMRFFEELSFEDLFAFLVIILPDLVNHSVLALFLCTEATSRSSKFRV